MIRMILYSMQSHVLNYTSGDVSHEHYSRVERTWTAGTTNEARIATRCHKGFDLIAKNDKNLFLEHTIFSNNDNHERTSLEVCQNSRARVTQSYCNMSTYDLCSRPCLDTF